MPKKIEIGSKVTLYFPTSAGMENTGYFAGSGTVTEIRPGKPGEEVSVTALPLGGVIPTRVVGKNTTVVVVEPDEKTVTKNGGETHWTSRVITTLENAKNYKQ